MEATNRKSLTAPAAGMETAIRAAQAVQRRGTENAAQDARTRLVRALKRLGLAVVAFGLWLGCRDEAPGPEIYAGFCLVVTGIALWAAGKMKSEE